MKQSPHHYDIDEMAGTYTKSVLDNKIYSYALDSRELSEVLSDSAVSNSFSDGLRWLLKECGYIGSVARDREAERQMKDFIHSAFVQMPCEKRISDKTIGRWISGVGKPNDTAKSRESVFMLMFALHADIELTTTFFKKYYYAQPFNFRSSNECIYYWCLKSHRTLDDAMHIMERVTALWAEMQDAASFSDRTIQIGKALDELETEEELSMYVASTLHPHESYFQTAKQLFSELLEEAKQLAEDTYDKLDLDTGTECRQDSIGYKKQKHSVDFLLTVIFGANKKITFQDDCDSLICENFPTKEQFSRCIKDETTNADILRKILILLMFFITYADNMDTDLDCFVSNVDYQLEECGFPTLYPANPYDRIFLLCVYHGTDETGPLEYFREVFQS